MVNRAPPVSLALSLVPAAGACVLAALPDSAFDAFYTRGIYSGLTTIFATLTGWTSLPLGFIGLPIVVALLLWRVLRPARPYRLLPRLLRLAVIAACLLGLYYLLWGANYRRPPLAELLALGGLAPGEAEMVDLAWDMHAWVVTGVDAERSEERALAAVALQLEELMAELGYRVQVPARLKELPAGTLMQAGYAGMMFPFTLEPQVDGALAPHSRVAAGAHELAHVAGLAAEADADLASLLAGLRARNDFARYSVALVLLARMLPSLPPTEAQALRSTLPARAGEDLALAREQATRYLRRGLAERVSATYDRFLRRQGVSRGVADYARLPQQAALARRAGLLPSAPMPGP